MKTLLLALIVFFSFNTVFLSEANAFQRLETTIAGGIEHILYFSKKMEDQNSFDKNFQRPEPLVRIKILMVCNTLDFGWCENAEKALVKEAENRHWVREDYLNYLDWKLWDLYEQSDDGTKMAAKEILAKLKRKKKRAGNRYFDNQFYEQIIRDMIDVRAERGRAYNNKVLDVLGECLPGESYYPDAIISLFDNNELKTYYSFGGKETSLYYRRGETTEVHFGRLLEKAKERLAKLGLK